MPLIDGRKVIAATGTAEPLVLVPRGARWLIITALSSNTGIVTIGGSPLAAVGTREGAALAAGAFLQWSQKRDGDLDLSDFFIDASVNGEGVSWAAGVSE